VEMITSLVDWHALSQSYRSRSCEQRFG